MSEDRREQSAGGWRKELYLWLGTAVAILTVLTPLFVFVGRIIVVDNNRIVEEGTHQELLQSGGEYAQLYNAQKSVSV